MICTVFKTKQLNPNHEITPIYYMHGDKSKYENIDFDTDYRFCEVKDKRAKAEIIGEIEINI